MARIKMQDCNRKTLDGAFAEFITFKKINNLSKESLHFYEDIFRIFGLYHDTAQLCESVTRETIFKYVEHLQKKGTTKDVTINSYLRGLRTILGEWLYLNEKYDKI